MFYDIGSVVCYKSIDGSLKFAEVQRYVESTCVSIDLESKKEVVFDCSDLVEWVPKIRKDREVT
jgi:hypothetical protein